MELFGIVRRIREALAKRRERIADEIDETLGRMGEIDDNEDMGITDPVSAEMSRSVLRGRLRKLGFRDS